MRASGAHCVRAQDIPSTETSNIEGVGEFVRHVDNNIREVKILDAPHALGSVSHVRLDILLNIRIALRDLGKISSPLTAEAI
jgi:hypothetical protein